MSRTHSKLTAYNVIIYVIIETSCSNSRKNFVIVVKITFGLSESPVNFLSVSKIQHVVFVSINMNLLRRIRLSNTKVP